MKSAKIVASALATLDHVPKKKKSDDVVSRPEIICPDLPLNCYKSCSITNVPVVFCISNIITCHIMYT